MLEISFIEQNAPLRPILLTSVTENLITVSMELAGSCCRSFKFFDLQKSQRDVGANYDERNPTTPPFQQVAVEGRPSPKRALCCVSVSQSGVDGSVRSQMFVGMTPASEQSRLLSGSCFLIANCQGAVFSCG